MLSKGNGSLQDITVKNNFISAFRLLNVWGCRHIMVVNNSFKSELPYKGESGYGIELHDSPNAKVVNNLFYDVGQHLYPYLFVNDGSQPGLDVGYNCHYMSDGRPPAGQPWSQDLWQTDPKLINPGANDFHLLPESPLIHAGIVIQEVLTDYDGHPRPQGSGYAIGAFEFSKRKLIPAKNLRIIK